MYPVSQSLKYALAAFCGALTSSVDRFTCCHLVPLIGLGITSEFEYRLRASVSVP